MTLGLVYGGDQRIDTVIESCGIFAGLQEKSVIVQPGIVVLVAGGLEHWRDAFAAFSPTGTLMECAESLAKVLDQYMTSSNRAFGLVCGYESGDPVGYRINRDVGHGQCTVQREHLRTVQAIGGPKGLNVPEVARRAQDRIQKGEDVPTVLREEIERCRFLTTEVRLPVVSKTIPAP